MHDETDEFFKTALNGLDDVPPPGAAFDANALWQNLDAELRPRRRVAGWWVAAAVSLLVLAGAGWWLWPGEWSVRTPTTAGTGEPPRSVAHRPESVANRPSAPVGVLTDRNLPKQERFVRIATAPSTPSQPKQKPALQPRRGLYHLPFALADGGPESPAPVGVLTNRNLPKPEWSVSSPTTAATQRPPTEELPIILTEKILTESAKPQPTLATRTTKTKPRFRVVPENELRTAEEARPKLHRSEGTARVMLGFPSAPEPEPNPTDRQPYFILSPKPN